MTLQTGKIYKVKEGHEGKCGHFIKLEGKFIQIKDRSPIGNNLVFTILDIDKEKIGNYDYHGYFTEDDLELEEEITPHTKQTHCKHGLNGGCLNCYNEFKEHNSIEEDNKCACGEKELIGGANLEIAGFCHRKDKPCYELEEEVKEHKCENWEGDGYINKCVVCGKTFKENDLKQKSLEDLEVGDEVIRDDSVRCQIIAQGFYLEETASDNCYWTSKDSLIHGYKLYKPVEIKQMSPSEAETLLEEKLGIKVKIK